MDWLAGTHGRRRPVNDGVVRKRSQVTEIECGLRLLGAGVNLARWVRAQRGASHQKGRTNVRRQCRRKTRTEKEEKVKQVDLLVKDAVCASNCTERPSCEMMVYQCDQPRDPR